MFDPYVIIALLVAVTIHECSHALVAYYLGDPTAKLAGRISLNPLAHLDPMGTIMLFLIHFGWGKPVPVNPNYFRHPTRDSSLTAFAGPVSNLILAFVLALPLKYLPFLMPMWLERLLYTILDVNIFLCVFNFFPFAPLDGSKMIGILIPKRFRLAYDRYLQKSTLYFIIFLLFDQYVLAHYLGYSILQYLISTMAIFIKSVIFLGT